MHELGEAIHAQWATGGSDRWRDGPISCQQNNGACTIC